jgi:hypothetical protein
MTNTLILDGEKIPDDKIRNLFRAPPGLVPYFPRSALVVGSKGVGKTTLFRYLKETHEGLAIHVNLASALSCLAKETALGPLGHDYPRSLDPALAGKATALIAINLCERLLLKGLDPPQEELRRCLPAIAPGAGPRGREQFAALCRDTIRTPLQSFTNSRDTRSLSDLAAALGRRAETMHGPLLLLLDRADVIPPGCLRPLAELLDQSAGYVALLAMRPGHGGLITGELAREIVPGDHYGVVQLGTHIASPEWRAFVVEAVESQLGAGALARLPDEVVQRTVTLSRESVRTALEIFSRCTRARANGLQAELVEALTDQRENHLVACQMTLQQHHANFRVLVSDLRTQATKEHGVVDGPVVLSMSRAGQLLLFGRGQKLDRFVDAALRAGAFCMRAGERWAPGINPSIIELHPLLLWQKTDPVWSYGVAEGTSVRRSESQLLKSQTGPSHPPALFVAYRMDFADSMSFRRKVEASIRSHPALAGIQVLDGKVAGGMLWANEIRERIKRARLVVADVTGMRGDVLFEMGFAFGLRKPFIPVVSSPEDRQELPRWIAARQIDHYGSEDGLLRLITSIAARLADRGSPPEARSSTPIPGKAIWLGKTTEWREHVLEVFKTSAAHEGMTAELLTPDAPEETILSTATRASLAVVALDGGRMDSLNHFVCGSIVARPMSGYQRLLGRRVLVLEDPALQPFTLMADSLGRCAEVVSRIERDDLRNHIRHYGKEYREWMKSSGTKGSP